MVQGTADGTCIMKYVPRQTEINESDEVISSGIGGAFPKSLYVGDVIEVKVLDVDNRGRIRLSRKALLEE